MTLTEREQDLIRKYRKLNAVQKQSIDAAVDAIFTKDTYYNIKAAAGIIGVTYRTCLEYIRTGRLPAHKIGGKWAITADDLTGFLEGRQ